MKILIYGAGDIGQLYAARLQESGQDVSILARGQRLQSIRDHGIFIENFQTGKQSTIRVRTIECLAPEDAYDLVLVILPRHCVADVLPILGANKRTPNVMFFGNNAGGTGEMTQALGQCRVVLGFPGAAAVPRGGAICYQILNPFEQATTIGELDGTESDRIREVAKAFQEAGLPVSVCANMDAWLKTHVAKIYPTATALYMASGDIDRLKRTPDALVLMVRAIKEGFKVLSKLGIPITPLSHRVIPWIPDPLLVTLMRFKLGEDVMKIKIGHAVRAHNEMRALAADFRNLIRQSGLDTPSINSLDDYLEGAEPVADGSSEIPIEWHFVWITLCLILAVLAYALY